MLKYRGQDWRQDALMSLAGVFQVKRKGVLPIALEGFLEEHPEVKTIHLHLDNDQVGQAAAKGMAVRIFRQEKHKMKKECCDNGKNN